MKLNIKNTIRFNHVLENVLRLADMINTFIGTELVEVSHEDGTKENSTGLVFFDTPSLLSICDEDKEMFEKIIHEADAVNFYALPDKWIRITFAVRDCWDDEHETDVVAIKTKEKENKNG